MKALGWYLRTEEGRAIARARQAEVRRLLKDAEDAGVPWHYDLSAGRDDAALASAFVARAIGEADPFDVDERTERDLQCLGDFAIQPIVEWQRERDTPDGGAAV